MEVARNSYSYFLMMVSALVLLVILRNLTGLSSAQVSFNPVFSLIRKSLIGILRRFFLWIDFIINTSSGLIYATEARIESLCCDLNELCAGLEVSAPSMLIGLRPLLARFLYLLVAVMSLKL